MVKNSFQTSCNEMIILRQVSERKKKCFNREFTRALRREVLSGSVDIFTVIKIYIN